MSAQVPKKWCSSCQSDVPVSRFEEGRTTCVRHKRDDKANKKHKEYMKVYMKARRAKAREEAKQRSQEIKDLNFSSGEPESVSEVSEEPEEEQPGLAIHRNTFYKLYAKKHDMTYREAQAFWKGKDWRKHKL